MENLASFRLEQKKCLIKRGIFYQNNSSDEGERCCRDGDGSGDEAERLRLLDEHRRQEEEGKETADELHSEMLRK